MLLSTLDRGPRCVSLEATVVREADALVSLSGKATLRHRRHRGLTVFGTELECYAVTGHRLRRALRDRLASERLGESWEPPVVRVVGEHTLACSGAKPSAHPAVASERHDRFRPLCK